MQDELIWQPSPEVLEHARVTALMRDESITDWRELHARAQDDTEWFWDAVVRFLDLRFEVPYERVLDTSNGIPWATWFEGGRLNLAVSCVDKWADRDEPAVVWEGEEGTTRE